MARGSGAGVIPSGTSEPWRWAENEARTNNALYEMFMRQAFDANQRQLARDDGNNDRRLQNEFTLQRDASQQDFTRERDANQQDFAMQREGRQQAVRVNNDTKQVFNRAVKDLVKELEIPEHVARGMVAESAWESGGFQQMQELAPVVKGSRGGFGFNQWTGPRRREFEAFAQQQGLDPTSYEANMGYWLKELREGRHASPGYLDRVKRAQSAFEAAQLTRSMFLRPQNIINPQRDRAVRNFLNIPEDAIVEQQTANTVPASNAQTVQQPSGQPQPANVQQPSQQVTAPQSRALGQRRFMPDPNNPSKAILVGG